MPGIITNRAFGGTLSACRFHDIAQALANWTTARALALAVTRCELPSPLENLSRMIVDLHCHSTASDGVLAPDVLVQRAHARGIELLALTDHDTLEGLDDARAAADLLGVRLVNGIELSCVWNGATIHVLGYAFRRDAIALQQAIGELHAGRWQRAETLKTMDSRSPLSMSVTLEMLRRGRSLSLADCFAMELHLDRQWFDEGDIIEGVRALIVDKDKNPRWNPPTLDEVTPERVAAFFAGA